MTAGSQPNHEPTLSRDAFFERVLHQHARLLYRVAHSVLRNPADAEDAVADALLKLIRSGAWQNINNERAFLARSVWRSALDRLAQRSPAGDDAGDALGLLQDDGPSPERSVMDLDEHAVLHALIDRLPAELRDPLLLSAVEELNSREIGEAMHLPEGTVRTRLMRARRQLREQYDELQHNRRGREVAARGKYDEADRPRTRWL